MPAASPSVVTLKAPVLYPEFNNVVPLLSYKYIQTFSPLAGVRDKVS